MTATRSPHVSPASRAAHEHSWITDSRHAVSAGYVAYVRCPACGARRVDLEEGPEQPPVALTRALTLPAAEPR